MYYKWDNDVCRVYLKNKFYDKEKPRSPENFPYYRDEYLYVTLNKKGELQADFIGVNCWRSYGIIAAGLKNKEECQKAIYRFAKKEKIFRWTVYEHKKKRG